MSKLELPTPDPDMIYHVKKIENFQDYAYLTVIDAAGERVLFFHYANRAYAPFLSDMAQLVPLHYVVIRNRLLSFARGEPCPCGISNQLSDAAANSRCVENEC